MTTMVWRNLRTRLIGHRESTLHGRIQWEEGEVSGWFFMNGHYSWGPGPQRLRAVGDQSASPVDPEIWRHGRKLRVERDGHPIYITNGTEAWDFHKDPARPILRTEETASYDGAMDYSGEAQWLIHPLPAIGWVGDDAQPDGPLE